MNETMTPSELEAIGQSVSTLMASSMTKVAETAGSRSTDDKRLFFPDGIQLIQIKVSATLKTGFEVSLTVSGDKAKPPATLSADEPVEVVGEVA
jgi:hypothetical protein